MSKSENKRMYRRLLAFVLSLAMVCMNLLTPEITFADTATHTYDANGFCTTEGCTVPYEKPEGDGTEDSPYQIGNAGELYYFAGIVNGDASVCTGGAVQNRTAYAELTADIEVNTGTITAASENVRAWTAIGKRSSFQGNFDGKNHTISGLYTDKASTERAALFGYCSYATVKNVGVENSYFGGNVAGGLVGDLTASKIYNSYSNAQVDGKTYGGGIAGDIYNNASYIENCYFAGSVQCELDTYLGAISGTLGSNVTNDIVVNTYCLNSSELVPIGGTSGNTSMANDAFKTADEFASGEVAWLLNQGIGTNVFGQTLNENGVAAADVQAVPVFGGKAVYAAGATAECPDSELTISGGYTNVESAVSYTYPNHNYVNGYCTACAGFEVPEGDGTAGNPYEIGNAGELYYFDAIIDGDTTICKDGVEQNANAYAVLTADIVVNEGVMTADSSDVRVWHVATRYEGNFDGQGHTISGLYGTYALFESAFSATIKNLGIVNSYFSGNDAGAFVRTAWSSNLQNCYMYNTTVQNTYSGTGSYTGGLAGVVYGSSSKISNCYAYGTVSSSSTTPAAIVGWLPDATIGNCYYLDTMADNAVTKSDKSQTNNAMSSEVFASGKVTFELNKEIGENIFKQTLAADGVAAEEVQTVPTFNGKTVYETGHAECPGAEVVYDGGYSNADSAITYTYKEHDYDEEGTYGQYICDVCGLVKEHTCEYEDSICIHCGAAKPPKGAGTEAEPYEISNSAELFWFAGLVNGDETVCMGDIQQNQNAYAVLTEDIVVNAEGVTAGSIDAKLWTSMADFDGVFDGQGHTISGLCYRGADGGFITELAGELTDVRFEAVSFVYEGADCGGIVACNDGAEISKVSVTGTIYADDSSYCIGAICGENYGLIEECHNEAEIEAEEVYKVGGICGYSGAGIIRSCSNTGTITGYDDVAGIVGNAYGCLVQYCYNTGVIDAYEDSAGIAGYVGNITITGCYNTGKILGDYYAGNLVGYIDAETEFENCYALAGASYNTEGYQKQYEGWNEVRAALFESGEVTWLLNQGLKEPVFYQTLTGEAAQTIPSYSGDKVVRLAEYSCPGATAADSIVYSNGEKDVNSYRYPLHNYDGETGRCTLCNNDKDGNHTCHYVDGICKYCEKYDIPEGKGTKASPYQIETAADLKWFAGVVNGDSTICQDGITQNPNACAILMNDIVVNEGVMTAGSVNVDVWTPIGAADLMGLHVGDRVAYNGVFDGNGHSISGLYAVAEADIDFIGLFGYMEANAVIKNLDVKNSYFEGVFAAGICVANVGTISDCSFDGIVYGEEADFGDSTLAMYAGAAGIAVSNAGTVKDCSVSAEINGEMKAAGLVLNNEGGMLESSVSSGKVQSKTDAAGITVVNDGLVKACVNSSYTSGSTTGGLIIYNSGVVAGSYTAGTTSGTSIDSDVLAETGSVYGNYYLAEEASGAAATAQQFASGEIAWKMNQVLGKEYYGQKLTGEDKDAFPILGGMKVYVTGYAKCPGAEPYMVTGYNNTGDVITYDHPNHSFPNDALYCEFCGTANDHTCQYDHGICTICDGNEMPEGNGADKPYEIDNAGKLRWFADKVSGAMPGVEAMPNANAVLTTDVALSWTVSEEAVICDWTSIGMNAQTGKTIAYEGTFDGQGFAVSGLKYINYSSADSVIKGALFDAVGKNGQIENLSLEGYVIEVESSSEELGALCNSNAGVITGCVVNGRIYVAADVTYIGGISGTNTNIITDCAVICGNDIYVGDDAEYAGGIVGYNEATVAGCIVVTNVEVDDEVTAIGGIAGYNAGAVTECVYDAVGDSVVVTADEALNAGGIAGYNAGSISSCNMNGMLQLIDEVIYAGGITGYNAGTLVQNEMSGAIESEDSYVYVTYAGGISGYNIGEIIACGAPLAMEKAPAEIRIVSEYGGGVCGYNKGSIERSNAMMEIYGYFDVLGGVCGQNEGSVNNSYFMGSMEADGYSAYEAMAGGIVGINNGYMGNCYSCNYTDIPGIYYLAGGSSVIENCYYPEETDAFGILINSNTDVKAYTQEEMMSGYLAWYLNQGQDEAVYGQTLAGENADYMPVIDGATVYPVMTLPCPNADLTYAQVEGMTNTAVEVTYQYEDHYPSEDGTYCTYCNIPLESEHKCSYDNGICAACNGVQAPEGDGSKENPYQISNYGELIWFAQSVTVPFIYNYNPAACAVLTDDIVCEIEVYQKWNTIGFFTMADNVITAYEGTFDGAYHTIEGIDATECINGIAALFYKIGNEGVVKNLALEDAVMRGTAVAGIANINSGTIENCSVNGTFEVKDTDSSVSATDFETTLMAGAAAGICGVNNGGTISSCWFDGVVSSSAAHVDVSMAGNGEEKPAAYAICGHNLDDELDVLNMMTGTDFDFSVNSTVEGCYYYLNPDVSGASVGAAVGGMECTDVIGSAEAVTEEQIRSGEAAKLLDTKGGTVLAQGIWGAEKETGYPVFAQNHEIETETFCTVYVVQEDGSAVSHVFPAGVNLYTELSVPEDYRLVYHGGQNGYADGAAYTDTALTGTAVSLRLQEIVLPTGEVSVGQSKWDTFLEIITFGLYQPRNVEVTITSEDAKTIEYYIYEATGTADDGLTTAELAGKNFSAYNADAKPVLNKDANVIVYVRLTNEYGDITYISTDGMIVNETGTAPTATPSADPSDVPSATPSVDPSDVPSATPSVDPSDVPSATPSVDPSDVPSATPSVDPSDVPSATPSVDPSDVPSATPSVDPSDVPSATPSTQPTPEPTDDVVKGDADLSGKVTLEDANLALRAALGIINLEGDALIAADVDGKEKVTLEDANLILRAALGIINLDDVETVVAAESVKNVTVAAVVKEETVAILEWIYKFSNAVLSFCKIG